MDDFQDIERYRFFNTNNLWLDLAVLEQSLAENDGVLPLPLIRNRKPVDPADPDSPSVFQLETAMGSAIGILPGARAVEVDRRRFAPVKRTDDLLLVRSDVYELDDAWRVVADPAFAEGGRPLPTVALDPSYYGLLDGFEARFPDGAPSLRGCTSLRIHGDLRFGAGVVCRGDVALENVEPTQRVIGDGSVLPD
jgi:UTP--glucose-1-phosphate uridylyltransferase